MYIMRVRESMDQNHGNVLGSRIDSVRYKKITWDRYLAGVDVKRWMPGTSSMRGMPGSAGCQMNGIRQIND